MARERKETAPQLSSSHISWKFMIKIDIKKLERIGNNNKKSLNNYTPEPDALIGKFTKHLKMN